LDLNTKQFASATMKITFSVFFLYVIFAVQSQHSNGDHREVAEIPRVNPNVFNPDVTYDISRCVAGSCAKTSYKEIQRMFRGMLIN
jgi:hypothetical protein